MAPNDFRIFTHARYEEILRESITQIQRLSVLKGGEYAGDFDRLANFRRNGSNLSLPMETIWAIYAAKHWDALMQYIQDLRSGKQRDRLESISGRVDDLLVYLILFKCMIEEREEKPAEAEAEKDLF